SSNKVHDLPVSLDITLGGSNHDLFSFFSHPNEKHKFLLQLLCHSATSQHLLAEKQETNHSEFDYKAKEDAGSQRNGGAAPQHQMNTPVAGYQVMGLEDVQLYDGVFPQKEMNALVEGRKSTEKDLEEGRAMIPGTLQKENERPNEENEWRAARNYADNITLEKESAHPNISIADDEKSFTSQVGVRQVPASPQRFDAVVAVLGSKKFSSGKHYWEVDISSTAEWDLGVARESIQRKGNISLSPKEGFWVLGLSGKDYWAKTDPWTRLTLQRKTKKIGIYLSFPEKRVAFFNVADMTVMFEFKDCSFTEPIYPFFKNTNKGSTMRICSIKEDEE
ncbi:putative butyrophilin subfamily 2 member A3, partial [Varanus komodoensis]